MTTDHHNPTATDGPYLHFVDRATGQNLEHRTDPPTNGEPTPARGDRVLLPNGTMWTVVDRVFMYRSTGNRGVREIVHYLDFIPEESR